MPAPSGKIKQSLETMKQHNPPRFRKLVAYAERSPIVIHEDDWDALVERGFVNDDGSMDAGIRQLVLENK